MRGQNIPDATTHETIRQEGHMEQRSRGVLSENKMRCVRGSVIGRASRKSYIRSTYRCLSGRDFRVTSSKGGVEWQHHLEITSETSKILSDTEMKYGSSKAEMFAVVNFVDNYRDYLGSEPFTLRVDNRALSWLKTNSINQNCIGRWIVHLDDYNLITEHMTRDKHQYADSLSKKTEFHEKQEQM